MVAEVVDFNDPDVDPDLENALTQNLTSEEAGQIRTFREGLNVAAMETDAEKSLPESLPSQVLYAPEDEYLEGEEDAVFPQNPAETPPPSSDENDNANQGLPEMVVNIPQPNAPQADPDREVIVPQNLETPPPEREDNVQQLPS